MSTKTIHSTMKHEEPSDYLIQALKESEADRKAGRYRSFSNAEDAIKWLRNPRRKYQNELSTKRR